MGLPQHIQKELGLGKGGKLSDTEQTVTDSAVSPHSSPVASAGARSNCTLTGEEQRHWGLIDFSNRPKSLAIPRGSIPQELLQSPVMCMSPQATYLSKIIPNAILPGAVDLVMIHASQNSLRTLSRSSLLLLPASPPAYSRSLSLHHHQDGGGFGYASSETWSHSQSSETIVSNGSTISSHGSREERHGWGMGEGEKSSTQPGLTNSLHGNNDNSSSPSPANLASAPHPHRSEPNGYSQGQGQGQAGQTAVSPTQSSGSVGDVSDTLSVTSERSVTRNLSVKKMKNGC